MANRRLSATELEQANAILELVRAQLDSVSGGDDALRWALRRKLYKELTYDERGKPMHRRRLKKFDPAPVPWTRGLEAGLHSCEIGAGQLAGTPLRSARPAKQTQALQRCNLLRNSRADGEPTAASRPLPSRSAGADFFTILGDVPVGHRSHALQTSGSGAEPRRSSSA
ncbi:MAG: hypothetical protein IPK26_10940 [Planctomycetes bacterium]|nr:hypothetical protein [Planctomycetota bacterium]